MKAKYFKKLRGKATYYLVYRSHSMFGDFKMKDFNQYTEVVGRNPKEAAKRYMKRTNALNDLNNYDQTPDQTNEMFGKLKVVPKDKPFERFVTYWK